jgi:hypothetical protein
MASAIMLRAEFRCERNKTRNDRPATLAILEPWHPARYPVAALRRVSILYDIAYKPTLDRIKQREKAKAKAKTKA